MDFKKFFPDQNLNEKNETKEKNNQKISQNQIFDVIANKNYDWYDIIYELIYSEQLDPWDVDIVLLTRRYFERIAELEEADFYISSKVLLAAALLLRIKSEFLLNKHIKTIDEILFEKKEDPKESFTKIDLEEELPILIPKTPLPRLRRVSLEELMNALNKAINTEVRRIKKEINIKRVGILSKVDFPKVERVSLNERIRNIYAKILTFLKKSSENDSNRISYFDSFGKERKSKLDSFLPILYLSNTRKIWLEQENHLGDIWIYLYSYVEKNKEKFFKDIEIEYNEKEKDFKK